jgi:hypothetical protein
MFNNDSFQLNQQLFDPPTAVYYPPLPRRIPDGSRFNLAQTILAGHTGAVGKLFEWK